MIDLNHLRIFERVAALKSFSAAARALALPKANVSRGIAKLEEELGSRLFQRTTREVMLTPTGEALKIRCADIIEKVNQAVDYVGGMTGEPRGKLKVCTAVGFAINVLATQLPEFLRRYPHVDITLDLAHHTPDVIAESVDVAIRFGPMPDSSLVATRLGVIKRYLCATPEFLERAGMPQSIQDVSRYDVIEMPGSDGRARPWIFTRKGATIKVLPNTRVCVNEVLTIHRLVMNGAGLGILSGYICEPEIKAGRLVRLFPEWALPSVEVNLIFPSQRELAPSVRAFAEFMKEVNVPGYLWQKDTLEA